MGMVRHWQTDNGKEKNSCCFLPFQRLNHLQTSVVLVTIVAAAPTVTQSWAHWEALGCHGSRAQDRVGKNKPWPEAQTIH